MDAKTLKKKIFKPLICLVFVMSLATGVFSTDNVSEAYTKTQKRTEKAIVKHCFDGWDKYGIYPSVALRQAWIESGMGHGPNLFGVMGSSHKNVKDSTYKYMQCINNGYYKGAPFAKSGNKQFYYIMRNGRYCVGQRVGGSYWRNANNAVDQFGWKKYDKKIKKLIKEKKELKAAKKRRKNQRGGFYLSYSTDYPLGSVVADPDYIKKGSNITIADKDYVITKSDKSLDDTIVIGVITPFDVLHHIIVKAFGTQKYPLQKVKEN